MKTKSKNIIFILWIIAIAVSFAINLFYVEYNVKMHREVGIIELELAGLTALIMICLKILGKIRVHWFFIPLFYAISGFVTGYVASFIPCCTGG